MSTNPEDVTASLFIGGIALCISIVALVAALGSLVLHDRNIKVWRAQMDLNHAIVDDSK